MDRPRLVRPESGPPTPEELAKKAEREHWRALAAGLEVLAASEGWDAYRELLEDLEKRAIQNLIGGGTAQHDHWAGYIAGLREAYNLPVAMAKKIRETA